MTRTDRADVQWCPTAEDIFLTWGTKLQLYQTREIRHNNKSAQRAGFWISPTRYASLICSTTEYPFIKCIAWCNTVMPDGARLLAVGQGKGSVRVTSIANLLGDTTLPNTREYDPCGPRHSRCVNSLAWSEWPESRQLLLAALDRSGREPSLLLYDVARQPAGPASQAIGAAPGTGSRHHHGQAQSSSWQRPAGEFCKGEHVHSAIFSRQSSSTLVAATDHKFLKVIDTRDGKQASSVSTKALYGLCCDPHSAHRFASYTENMVHVWDLRQSGIPVVSLPTPNPIIKLQWSPTRSGFLGCLYRESSFVRLFDLQYAGRDLLEASVSVRSACDTSPADASSFSWHATRYNTLLTASTRDCLQEHIVKERVTLNWSCRGDLVYSGDGTDTAAFTAGGDTAAAATASSHPATTSSHPATNSAGISQDTSPPQSASVSSLLGSPPPQQQQQLATNYGGPSPPLAVIPAVKRRSPPNPGKVFRLCAEDWTTSDSTELKPTTLDDGMTKLALSFSGDKKSDDEEEDGVPPDRLADDISWVMCQRAVAGYGLQCKENVGSNSDFVACGGRGGGGARQRSLEGVWQWLGRARALTKTATYRMKTGEPYNYHGILPILSQPGLRSDIFNKPWSGLGGAKPHTTRVFRSEERTICLQLAAWLPLDAATCNSATTPVLTQNTTLDEAIEAAQLAGEPCRAAALAVFQLHLPRAIAILQAAATSRHDAALSAIAMALAGYSGERKALWRDTCSTLRPSLVDPHLRAAFAFLTGEGDSYSPLLLSSELSVCDRLGFAATFLSDARLLEFVQQLKESLAELVTEDLQGLLLTGLDPVEGVEVVQRFVDRTTDVQTAALLALHGFRHTSGPALDPRLAYWVESYEQFLASQQLWWQRAQLSVLVPPQQPPHRVLVACYYCNNSISAAHLTQPTQPHSPPKNQLARQGQQQQHHNKSKVITCPHCRKPLPRCALCLQHLGSPSLSLAMHNQYHGHKAEKSSVLESPNAPHHLYIPAQTQARLRDGRTGLNPFGNWFTWCNTCRHGGHADHILSWFREHSDCPVTGCKCLCLMQDSIGSGQPQLPISAAAAAAPSQPLLTNGARGATASTAMA